MLKLHSSQQLLLNKTTRNSSMKTLAPKTKMETQAVMIKILAKSKWMRVTREAAWTCGVDKLKQAYQTISNSQEIWLKPLTIHSPSSGLMDSAASTQEAT